MPKTSAPFFLKSASAALNALASVGSFIDGGVEDEACMCTCEHIYVCVWTVLGALVMRCARAYPWCSRGCRPGFGVVKRTGRWPASVDPVNTHPCHTPNGSTEPGMPCPATSAQSPSTAPPMHRTDLRIEEEHNFLLYWLFHRGRSSQHELASGGDGGRCAGRDLGATPHARTHAHTHARTHARTHAHTFLPLNCESFTVLPPWSLSANSGATSPTCMHGISEGVGDRYG